MLGTVQRWEVRGLYMLCRHPYPAELSIWQRTNHTKYTKYIHSVIIIVRNQPPSYSMVKIYLSSRNHISVILCNFLCLYEWQFWIKFAISLFYAPNLNHVHSWERSHRGGCKKNQQCIICARITIIIIITSPYFCIHKFSQYKEEFAWVFITPGCYLVVASAHVTNKKKFRH